MTGRAILEEVCGVTGMGFAAVARVTEERWIACQELDRIEFGLALKGYAERGAVLLSRESGIG